MMKCFRILINLSDKKKNVKVQQVNSKHEQEEDVFPEVIQLKDVQLDLDLSLDSPSLSQDQDQNSTPSNSQNNYATTTQSDSIEIKVQPS